MTIVTSMMCDTVLKAALVQLAHGLQISLVHGDNQLATLVVLDA